MKFSLQIVYLLLAITAVTSRRESSRSKKSSPSRDDNHRTRTNSRRPGSHLKHRLIYDKHKLREPFERVYHEYDSLRTPKLEENELRSNEGHGDKRYWRKEFQREPSDERGKVRPITRDGTVNSARTSSSSRMIAAQSLLQDNANKDLNFVRFNKESEDRLSLRKEAASELLYNQAVLDGSGPKFNQDIPKADIGDGNLKGDQKNDQLSASNSNGGGMAPLERQMGNADAGDWKSHIDGRTHHLTVDSGGVQDADRAMLAYIEQGDIHMDKREAENAQEQQDLGVAAKAGDDWKAKAGELLEKAASELVMNVNETSGSNNTTSVNKTELSADVKETVTTAIPEDEKEPKLPDKSAAEEEHHSSLTIFFILLVVAISILVVHILIQTKFHYLPDSIAIVLIGACVGLFLKLFHFGNWKNEEAFPPTIFFIVLLPPIIFEGGYNLHKGNFFHNIGSILVFAVVGTVISAMIVGGGVYMLGQAQVVYQLNLVESFAFGSLVSAVDPVATLAIFQALDVDPILYMLVFGESMLNDAVSIVLTTTLLEFASPDAVVTSGTAAFFQAVGRFSLMFFGSAIIGVGFGLLSAVLTKFFDLHKTPSLEVGMVFCFSYLPYALAEGIHLSGIMAIMFCGIVMSHYTHLNLSPVSQITVQQTFRTIAFIAETCVFAYLGLAIFSFKVNVKPAFTIWSIILILVGRAANIFPLSFLMNFFREHKITRKNQFIMWFSGLRGAVAFALSLHMGLENEEKQYVLVTTTLILVLFTIVFLGGSTMPLLKFLQTSDKKYKKKKKIDAEVSMSKTKEMGNAIDSEHLSELTEDDEVHVIRHHMKGFLKIDTKYLVPFFTKRFTQQEMREGRSRVDQMANQWQMEVRAAPSETDGEDDSAAEIMPETALVGNGGASASRNGELNWK